MVGSNSPKSDRTIKFLCSYAGKILPRHPDGKLRYVGGETRVLAVDRFVPFSELLLKLGELCGSAVNLRCQLPTEDLDALVSITSDEDLLNLIEEYDLASRDKPSPLKIRAFLFPPKPKPSSPPSVATGKPFPAVGSTATATNLCIHQMSPPVRFPVRIEKSAGNLSRFRCVVQHTNPKDLYLVHNGNHWQ